MPELFKCQNYFNVRTTSMLELQYLNVRTTSMSEQYFNVRTTSMSELLQCQNYFSTRTTKIIARQYVLHEKGPGGFLGLTWVLKKNTNSAVSEILYTWTVSVNSDTAEESTSYSGAYWSYWSRLQGRLGYAVQWTVEFPLNSSCTVVY